jgi:phosphate acetyltransferase
MEVGQSKMPNSEAGQASVLIFPDLNTGNNTQGGSRGGVDW